MQPMQRLTRRSWTATTSLLQQTRRGIFIQTETTPNPHSMKFLPGEEVLPEQYGTGMYFKHNDLPQEIKKSPLAKSLFSVDGVKGVFLSRDVITVTKSSDVVWNTLKPQLFSKILDFFGNDKPAVITDEPVVSDTTILDDDDEVVAMIKELMETRVRPSVQDDGGDIYYEGFNPNTGIVSVRLAGSCVGCPSSAVTLRNGVENMLMHYIPEVKGIEEIGALDENGEVEMDTDRGLTFKPTTL